MHAQGTAVPSGQGSARFGTASADRIAYTVAEVAALLGKHCNTVYGWVRSGRAAVRADRQHHLHPQVGAGSPAGPAP
jgi:hypothetical protein